MFFKKKNDIKIELVNDDTATKLIIDYYSKKNKQEFRTELLRNLLSDRDFLFTMIDTNLFSKMDIEYEKKWIENIKEWLLEKEIQHQVMKSKKEANSSVIGSLLNVNKSKNDNYSFRVGVLSDISELTTVIKYHDQVKMGLHLGVGVIEKNTDYLLREYCSGLIDEYNRFDFYEIDIYDYLEVGRMVIYSDSFEKISNIKTWIQNYLISG